MCRKGILQFFLHKVVDKGEIVVVDFIKKKVDDGYRVFCQCQPNNTIHISRVHRYSILDQVIWGAKNDGNPSL